MADVRQIRVVIVYTDELKSISVDGSEMDDADVIRNKPIREWFSASNGRDGWEGLIAEINKVVDDDEAELNFEFQGPKESKYVFEECIAKLGFGNKADGLEAEDIAERNMEEAVKAEHRGLYKRALDCYVNAADFGNFSEAQYIVAGYYYRCYKGEQSGIDISKEDAIANAVEYYEKAALQGDARAQYQLYMLFSEREDVKQDWYEAVRWLTMAAESGDAVRQVELGDCLHNLEMELDEAEREKNVKEAFMWYQKAADVGYVKAYIRLGKCYRCGAGTEKDDSKAFEWYKKAANEGSVEAQYNIARCCCMDNDLKNCFLWYESAAKAGSLMAQWELAECYYKGKGVEKDRSLAFEWYTKVAERCKESIDQWEKENSSGWWINDKIIEAQYKQGICYEYGYGVEIDQKKAFDRYLTVASYVYDEDDYCEKGDYEKHEKVDEAQNEVGYRYEFGMGIEKDLKLAFEWYKKSAENGNRTAKYNLGDMYEYGKGVEKNPRLAYEWYKKSAENDYAAGQCSLGRCYDFAIGVEKNYKKAAEWYAKAVKNNDISANYFLGQCYEYGTGVDKSLDKAKKYYEKAFAGGDSDAGNKLMLMEVKELCSAFNKRWSGRRLNRTQNLVKAYELNDKKVYFSCDTSWDGSGEWVFAITDGGIYDKSFLSLIDHICDHQKGDSRYISYECMSKIDKISYESRDKEIYLGKYIIMFTDATDAFLQALVSLLGKIRDTARKYLG